MVTRSTRWRHFGLATALVVLAATRWLFAQSNERSRMAQAHDASRASERCAECHAAGDARRSAPLARGGCDAQCISCHAEDAKRMHPVGAAIPELRVAELHRSSTGRIACRTCHDLSRSASDSVPWRAQSLFDAVFRRQPRYPTYLLAMRNQRGQLCQSCH